MGQPASARDMLDAAARLKSEGRCAPCLQSPDLSGSNRAWTTLGSCRGGYGPGGYGSGHSAQAFGTSRFRSDRGVRSWRIALKKSAAAGRPWTGGSVAVAPILQAGAACAPSGMSLAILRRFWAAAARRNSSRAPFGPRRRSRSSLRIRLRCANSISTFFRSRREVT